MSGSLLAKLRAFDERHRTVYHGLLAGVDEAGRGPLAGPVVAAAVLLNRRLLDSGHLLRLNDSKKLSAVVREKLFLEISRYAVVSIGVVEETRIDEINIYQATRLAMKRAVLGLPRTPDHLLIDGTLKLDLPIGQTAIKGGDSKSASIAAASVVAKVHRDAWMCRLDELYPDYDFKQHKGYGTPRHIQKINEHGPSPVHRKTFYPVQNLIITAHSPQVETAQEG